MRLLDNYAYANPYLEPVSLDALAAPDPDDGEALTYPLADPATDIERDFDLAQIGATITAFLNTLDARDRELVRRVYWQDETQADVARHLQVSGAAISKRMSRIEAKGRVALAALRTCTLLQ